MWREGLQSGGGSARPDNRLRPVASLRSGEQTTLGRPDNGPPGGDLGAPPAVTAPRSSSLPGPPCVSRCGPHTRAFVTRRETRVGSPRGTAATHVLSTTGLHSSRPTETRPPLLTPPHMTHVSKVQATGHEPPPLKSSEASSCMHTHSRSHSARHHPVAGVQGPHSGHLATQQMPASSLTLRQQREAGRTPERWGGSAGWERGSWGRCWVATVSHGASAALPSPSLEAVSHTALSKAEDVGLVLGKQWGNSARSGEMPPLPLTEEAGLGCFYLQGPLWAQGMAPGKAGTRAAPQSPQHSRAAVPVAVLRCFWIRFTCQALGQVVFRHLPSL